MTCLTTQASSRLFRLIAPLPFLEQMQETLDRTHCWYATGEGQLARDLQRRSSIPRLPLSSASNKAGHFHW